MKKKFKCEIDCAACAAKVEEAIKKVEGVEEASVNFLTQKFTLVAAEEHFEEVLQAAIKAGKRAEADFEVEV
ncbi:MAG: cation transporter [Lachnospiraceae bacterium]|nr:cation transporter [Lachnospiraceae bacterium]